MTGRRRLTIAGLAAAAAALASYLYFSGGEEARIRSLLQAGKRAVEKGDSYAVLHMLDDAYDGDYGRTKRDAQSLAQYFFAITSRRDVYLDVARVQINGDRATARARFRIEGRGRGLYGYPEEQSFAYPSERRETANAEATFIRRDKEWRVSHVTIEGLAPMDGLESMGL
ncbi:MAG: hypothetical protein NTW86_18600 [Candidatus Sumerlaeota bacterium]|nr:hypothetical protein [Candidatus Sumerlaeota bacterium]